MRYVLCVMLAGLVVSPAAAQRATEADYYNQVRDWSRQLVNDLEYIQQDIAYEVKGPRGRQLSELAGTTYQLAHRFHRGLKTNVPREQLYRDYQRMDDHVHKLLRAIRDLGPNERSLQRAAARVHNADQQLHYALSQGDTSEPRGRDVLTRQLHLLAQQAADMSATIDWATQGSAAGARMRQAGTTFADAAQHLHESAEKNASPDHIRRDFGRVANAWREIIDSLNAPEASPGQYLLTKANQTHETVERLRQRLNLRDPYVRPRDRD